MSTPLRYWIFESVLRLAKPTLDALGSLCYGGAVMTSADLVSRQADSAPPTFAADPISRKDVVDVVMDRIIDIVGTGTLRADQKLPSEKELMTAFGVGRSSIREALRSLVAMNLLETRPGKGYFVSPMAPTLIGSGLVKDRASGVADFYEVMEARKVLEIAIAEMALVRATAKDFREVRRAGEELEAAAAERSELLPYTMRVHLAIARSAHNAFLTRLLTDLLPWIMALFTPVRVSTEVDVRMHIQLMEAFLSRDEDMLTTALGDHHDFWSTKFVECFPQDSAGSAQQSVATKGGISGNEDTAAI